MNNMLEALERTAQRVSERVAFYDDHESMTFADLMNAAKSIGSCLASRVPPRQAVALLLDARSIRNIPAMYGVMYAGCAYAPLDIAMPPERLDQLLRLLAPAAILADEKGIGALNGISVSDIPVVRYADAAQARIYEPLLRAVRAGSRIEDPMSILYTSGSTGIPKGAVQTQASYIRWTEATIRVYDLKEDTAFANQSPFFYANSILEIFPPVALGATVYLLPAGVLTFPRRLIESLNARKITCLCMTPSSFISVVNAGVLEDGCLPGLKWGVMSGESMPWQPLETWMRAAPNAAWWHFYGSTEMFSVAVGKVEKPQRAEDRLPVGRLFAGVDVQFLDENGQSVPAGEPGEMYVSSPWVSQGYHRDESRTALSWTDLPQGRYYRSGDMGYLRPDGQLMVLGRRDSQIKHMGYRMELGEVEAAVRGLKQIAESAILYDREGDRIFCFYTGDAEEKTVKNLLKARLARYMLPDVFVHLAEMPHTASMKINRAALTKMMEGNCSAAAGKEQS